LNNDIDHTMSGCVVKFTM